MRILYWVLTILLVLFFIPLLWGMVLAAREPRAWPNQIALIPWGVQLSWQEQEVDGETVCRLLTLLTLTDGWQDSMECMSTAPLMLPEDQKLPLWIIPPETTPVTIET